MQVFLTGHKRLVHSYQWGYILLFYLPFFIFTVYISFKELDSKTQKHQYRFTLAYIISDRGGVLDWNAGKIKEDDRPGENEINGFTFSNVNHEDLGW